MMAKGFDLRAVVLVAEDIMLVFEFGEKAKEFERVEIEKINEKIFFIFNCTY